LCNSATDEARAFIPPHTYPFVRRGQGGHDAISGAAHVLLICASLADARYPLALMTACFLIRRPSVSPECQVRAAWLVFTPKYGSEQPPDRDQGCYRRDGPGKVARVEAEQGCAEDGQRDCDQRGRGGK
jgi:hypothetical protein